MYKKRILALVSLLTISSVYLFSIYSKNQLSPTSGTVDEVWRHYNRVESTYNSNGCKEYWISCLTHQIVFAKPDGMIEDNGALSSLEISNLATNDKRVLLKWKVDDSTIRFGHYPQTRVDDASIISVLESKITSWIDYDYWLDYTTYFNDLPFMFYTDVMYDGELYRGVYFDQPRDHYQKWFGYEANNHYWFKFEPIIWRKLYVENNEAVLISDIILDAQEYKNSASGSVMTAFDKKDRNYESSSLYEFIKDKFNNWAFSSYEFSKILYTNNDGYFGNYTGEIQSSAYSGPDNLCEKVFVPNVSFLTNSTFGYASSGSYSTNRKLIFTDYARCQGLQNSSSDTYGYWWVSSCSLKNNKVYPGGYIDSEGYCYQSYGVVPAMRLDISK